MPDGCIGNCLVCGKCGSFTILDEFDNYKLCTETRDGYGIAADIGTTSVVLALVNLSSGKIPARHSFMNPQRAFGPDVISRIDSACGGHLEDMRRLITQSVAEGCLALVKSCNILPVQIRDMAVAGNTTMTYLMLGFPCGSLGAFPFKPEYRPAESYGFSGVFGASEISCPVRIVPWLAAFVGGDVTAGLLHILNRDVRRFILIDLGTNGEMALYDDGKLTVTSTAAGPAFERANHGGGASGTIDALAEMVRHGQMDETGLLKSGSHTVFGQKEIRDLQLAKSAVRSGLEILMTDSGLDCSALDSLYLAGGIGQAMNPDCAVTIGLIPSGLREKTRAVGNSSLAGAARLLLSPKSTAADIEMLTSAVKEINLAAHPRFNDLFMEHMYFDMCGY